MGFTREQWSPLGGTWQLQVGGGQGEHLFLLSQIWHV